MKFAWKEDELLPEIDARIAVLDAPKDQLRRLRTDALRNVPETNWYLLELASAAGLTGLMASNQLNQRLSAMQTNLYLGFIDLCFLHGSTRSATALVHEDSFFFDPNGTDFRREAYLRLRRACLFRNELFLFDDLSDTKDFCFTIYGPSIGRAKFLFGCWMFSPSMFDASLKMTGEPSIRVGIKTAEGEWDSRPSGDRITFVDGPPAGSDIDGTPAGSGSKPSAFSLAVSGGAPLSKVVLRSELDAIAVLTTQDHVLATEIDTWSRGVEEDVAKRDGMIIQRTFESESPDSVILQGPHFSVGTPLAKTVRDADGREVKWTEWSSEEEALRFLPATGYAFIGPPPRMAQWSVERFRVVHRKRTNVNMERALHVAIIPPGPVTVGTCYMGTFKSEDDLGIVSGLGASIPWEYLVRVSGRSDVTPEFTDRLPFPKAHPLGAALVHRALRLNCLTTDYAPLWEDLFDPSWEKDGWAAPQAPWGRVLARVPLGDVASKWTMGTPLRRDAERRMALVEIDAIAAIMLGLTAEQLCAMYRTQFAVLRKYEYAMAFDQEGRKVCQHHQSAGYRQSRLQQRAKDGELDKRWRNIWQLVLEEEERPGSVDWEGHFTPPFVRPDRESEMTHAYEVFTRRLADAGGGEGPA